MDVPGRIITAATSLMAAHGYDGTSVQAIADAVGIRKASVLYHYPSKEVLHQAGLEALLSHWNDVLPGILLASARDGIDRFDAVMLEVTRFFQADPDRARLLVRELLDRPNQITRYLQDFARPWLEIVSTSIERGKRSEEIRQEVDAEVYVLSIVNLIMTTWASIGVVEKLVGDIDHERQLLELIRIAKTSLFAQPNVLADGSA